jgi:hypothetical protein
MLPAKRLAYSRLKYEGELGSNNPRLAEIKKSAYRLASLQMYWDRSGGEREGG